MCVCFFYLITSGRQVYLGCMIPNLLGTEFRQLDHRVDPRDPGTMDYVKEKGKNELSATVYGVNVMGRWAAGVGGGVYSIGEMYSISCMAVVVRP